MPDYYIGLMSGTSMDGIDAVLVSFTDHGVELLAAHGHPYPDTLRHALGKAVMTPPDEPIPNLGALDRQVGEQFRDAANELLRIAEMADRYGVDLCPHSWHNGLMAMEHAHYVAGLPNPRVLEVCQIQGPLQWAILKEPPVIEDGYLILPDKPGAYTNWAFQVFVSMMAILFLPRQFQVAVVENVNADHLRKASWLFPLYLLVINIFVLPIALGGHLLFAGGEGIRGFAAALTIGVVLMVIYVIMDEKQQKKKVS